MVSTIRWGAETLAVVCLYLTSKTRGVADV